MAKDKEETQDFVIDIDEKMANATPNEGGEFKRIPVGDYRLRITAADRQPNKENTHVMLKPTFVIVAAHDDGNKDAVGMSLDSLYAGSKESPKFMQERLACLVRACAVKLTPGMKLDVKKHLIGREFDATIYHELSEAKFNEATGLNDKRYVNARICGERTTGTKRNPKINPAAMSKDAAAWLLKTYGDGADDDAPAGTDTAGKPAWEQPDAGATSADAAPEAQPEGDTVAGFRPEEEADEQVHEYRAFYQLKTPMADQAKEGLIGVGFDPDGPVKPELLTEPTRKEWIKKFPPKSANGALGTLPPLGGPKKGQRAPATK